MKVNTIPGAAYALTCTAACSVQALLSDASCLTVLETENSGQYIFVAPTDAVEVSDEHALVTQTFKVAALGLAAQGGIRLGEDAVLKNLTAEASTFSGTVNANGGINAVSGACGRSLHNRPQRGQPRRHVHSEECVPSGPRERNRYHPGGKQRQDGAFLGGLVRAVLGGQR